MKKIVLCFQQTGGANALLPLLEGWQQKFQVIIICRDVVSESLGRHGVNGSTFAQVFGNDYERKDIVQWLEEIKPDLLITDTINLARVTESWVTYFLWEQAGLRAIPSIAYVDCWWGYGIRFFPEPDSRKVVLPSMIVAIDDNAGIEMTHEGLPADRIKVLGSPRFEQILQYQARESKIETKTIAQDLGIRDGDLLLTFVSQPLGKDAVEKWGFNEETVFRAVLESIGSYPAYPEISSLKLAVILHPEEDEAVLRGISVQYNPGLDIIFYQGKDALDIIVASDLVLGMASILLVEAVLMKKPVLSIQPGLKREDMLVTNRTGATKLITSIAELQSCLHPLLLEQQRRDELLQCQQTFAVVTDATKRWNAAVARYM